MKIFLKDLSFELPRGLALDELPKPYQTTMEMAYHRAGDTVYLRMMVRATSNFLDVFLAEVTYGLQSDEAFADDEAAQVLVPYVLSEIMSLTQKAGLGALRLPQPYLVREALPESSSEPSVPSGEPQEASVQGAAQAA
jgi:preprotein translocase subunit SecB